MFEARMRAAEGRPQEAWNDPEDSRKRSAGADDWHTTDSKVDLRAGDRFGSRASRADGPVG
jgi:hypothetical protein